LAGELERVQAGALGDGTHALELREPRLNPASRPKPAMVAAREAPVNRNVPPEEPAVVHDPRDHANVVLGRRPETELGGPRLERVEDDHRPVDQLAEALEAPDEVDREAIRRTGSDADHLRQPGVAKRRHALPDILALEPGAVRVVKEEQIERVDAQPLEAPLACRPQVVAVLAAAPQPPVREPRESARHL